MNKLFLLGIVILFSSCRKEKLDRMTVVRDCTGTYLRFEEKDYHVCNISKLASYSDGAKVKVSFNRIEQCTLPNDGQAICEMMHINEGWIEVKEIK